MDTLEPSDSGEQTKDTVLGGIRARCAVVLAAGQSERMSPLTAGDSKAQLRVGGVSLVERAVRRLLSLGIEDVIVVVGSQSTSVQRSLGRVSPHRVRTVFAERWADGNGASLVAAEAALSDEPLFIVMTADHLFSDGAIDELVSTASPSVLIDPCPDSAVWSEGTRVQIEDGRAVAFSKALDEPTLDCGVFTLTPGIFEAQRRASAAGDGSLAGAISRLAADEHLAAVPLPPGAWWHDIDVPEDLHAARRSLRRSLGKPSDGPVARTLNRPISTRVSMVISRLRPNPMTVSLLTLAVSAAAGVLLALGKGIAGGVLLQLGSIGDGIDGELARLQYRASAWGALMDGVFDRLADAIAIAGLTIWAVHDGPLSYTWAIVLATAAATGSLMSMASKDRIRALGLRQAREDRLSLLFGGRDARLLLVAIAAVLGAPVVGLILVILTTTITLVFRLVSVARSSETAEGELNV
ncbi:MAG: NTP transferase domain-containing protein [Gaiellales bacterium]